VIFSRGRSRIFENQDRRIYAVREILMQKKPGVVDEAGR